MKLAIYILCAVEGLVFLAFAGLGTGQSDAAGNAMSAGFAAIGGMLLAMFLMPAALLARANRALPFALGLTCVPILIYWVFRDVL